MNITTKPVEYFDGKQKCVGYLAWDESVASARPCVLINHAWGGRDDFAEQKAVQMAALGYVGFALDNYGDHQKPESLDDKIALMGPLKEDREALLKRLKAGMDAASKLDEVDSDYMAAIGYCFGGLCTLDMARAGLNLKAAVSFHGLLDTDNAKNGKVKAKVLIAHGYDDPMSKPDTIAALGDQLTKAGCDWQIHAYGQTSHAFTVPDANDKKLGLQYHAASDQRSMNAMLSLLDEVFSAHGVA